MAKIRWIVALVVGCMLTLAAGTAGFTQGLTLHVLYSPEFSEILEPTLERYESQTNVQIERVLLPTSSTQWSELVIARHLAGLPNDVILLGGVSYGDVMASGLLLDLRSQMERDVELSVSDFIPAAIAGFYEEGGAVWGLPFGGVVRSLQANVTMINNAGLTHPNELSPDEWTWDELQNYVQRLTRFDPNGRPEVYGIGADHLFLRSLINQAGGYWLDRPARPTRSGALLPGTVEAVRYLADFFHPTPYARWGGRVDRDPIAFGYQVTATLPDLIASGDVVQYDLIRYAKGPVNRGGTLFFQGFTVGSNTQHPDESWELIKFLATDRDLARSAVQDLYRAPAYIPNIDFYTPDAFPQNAPPGIVVLMEILQDPDLTTLPISWAWGDFHQFSTTALSRDIPTGNQAVELVLQQIHEYTEALLAQGPSGRE